MLIFKDTSKDILLVLLTLVCLIIIPIFAVYFDYLNMFEIILLSILCVILLNAHLNTSMHYQIHRSVFNNKKLNRIYEYICSIPACVGFEEYRYIHTEHHKYSNDRYVDGKIGDPVSTYRFGKDGKEDTFWTYIFKSTSRNYYYGEELIPRNVNVNWKEIKIQNYMKFAFLIFLGFINYKFAFLYLLIVYSTWLFNAALSYCEHYNVTDWHQRGKNSVSCYNKWYNLLFFNSGYHQEHHYSPGVHWCDLPKLTQYLPSDRNIVKYTLFHNNPYYRKK
jgi:fatty acid desaturase